MNVIRMYADEEDEEDRIDTYQRQSAFEKYLEQKSLETARVLDEANELHQATKRIETEDLETAEAIARVESFEIAAAMDASESNNIATSAYDSNETEVSGVFENFLVI